MNVWFDHGLGKDGTLIDFGKLYHQCTIKELLFKLKDQKAQPFLFHPHNLTIASEKKMALDKAGNIEVISAQVIRDPVLREYLHSRQIPIIIANQFCAEVDFELYGKRHLAIGFKNDEGGFELRNVYFKGSSSPKSSKLIPERNANALAVFEGFFIFLSLKRYRNPVQ